MAAAACKAASVRPSVTEFMAATFTAFIGAALQHGYHHDFHHDHFEHDFAVHHFGHWDGYGMRRSFRRLAARPLARHVRFRRRRTLARRRPYGTAERLPLNCAASFRAQSDAFGKHFKQRQRFGDRAQPHAAASDLAEAPVAREAAPVAARGGEVDKPDRLSRRAAAGTGNAGDRHGKIGVRILPARLWPWPPRSRD